MSPLLQYVIVVLHVYLIGFQIIVGEYIHGHGQR